MDSIPDVLQFTALSTSFSSVVQGGAQPEFLDQWRSITSKGFVLNMAKGHHLQLRHHPPLFHNFIWFNIKAATGHHHVIQKELDEILAKGAIEPLTGDACFYWNVFMVPKHAGGLWLLLNIKWFNCYIHIPTFKMPTFRKVQQLIEQSDYSFSIDLNNVYCIFFHFTY